MYRFDFARGTYGVPSMKIVDAPMRDLDVSRAGTTFIAKFRIELAKPVYVQFVRNVPQGTNGPTGAPPDLTAGRRIIYPATSDSAEIVAIAGMRCSLAGDR